jgi:hypothetical protein
VVLKTVRYKQCMHAMYRQSMRPGWRKIFDATALCALLGWLFSAATSTATSLPMLACALLQAVGHLPLQLLLHCSH